MVGEITKFVRRLVSKASTATNSTFGLSAAARATVDEPRTARPTIVRDNNSGSLNGRGSQLLTLVSPCIDIVARSGGACKRWTVETSPFMLPCILSLFSKLDGRNHIEPSKSKHFLV